MDSNFKREQSSWLFDGKELPMGSIRLEFSLENLCKVVLVSPLIGALALVPWGHQNAPAWVQAIGSIGAIYVAVQVARRADRRAERKEAQQELVMLQVVSLTAAYAAGLAEQIREGLLGNWTAHGQRQAREVALCYLDTLSSVRAASLPNPDLVAGYLRVVGALRDLEQSLSPGFFTGPVEFAEVDERCRRMIQAEAEYQAVATRRAYS